MVKNWIIVTLITSAVIEFLEITIAAINDCFNNINVNKSGKSVSLLENIKATKWEN